jgi:hypothetical protein
VGSLVLVRSDPNGGGEGVATVLDVRQLHNGDNLIVVDAASSQTNDFHFVVNDLKGCENVPTSPALTITAQVLRPENEVAELIADKLIDVILELRDKTDSEYLGSSLPSAGSYMLSNALSSVENVIEPYNLSDFPKLEHLFTTFVLGEELRRERLARIRVLRESLRLLNSQLASLHEQRRLLEETRQSQGTITQSYFITTG